MDDNSRELILKLKAENSAYKAQLADASETIEKLGGNIRDARYLLRCYRILHHSEWNARATAMDTLRKLQQRLFLNKIDSRLVWHYAQGLPPNDPNLKSEGSRECVALGWCNLEQFPIEDPQDRDQIVEYSWRRRTDTGNICRSNDNETLPEVFGNPDLERHYLNFMVQTNIVENLVEGDCQSSVTSEEAIFDENYKIRFEKRMNGWLAGHPRDAASYERPSSAIAPFDEEIESGEQKVVAHELP